MEILNRTPCAEGIALGPGADRRPCLGVVLKATFRLPEGVGGIAELAEEQLPLVAEDEHYDGDATGSVRLERDLVPFKPRADIVLVGSAHVPGGRAATELDVGLRVGRVQHVARVIGDRRWLFPSRAVLVPTMSRPEPFTTMPLVYERAFGGTDRKGRAWLPQNPVGRGFLGKKTSESVDGRALPNVEDPRRPIRSWDDQPAPVGFGFVGRHWQPRAALAGTPAGLANPDPVFGLPSDFQPAFYNAASSGLQVPGYLEGNEEVEMRHLTPDGYRRFRLAGLRPEIVLHLAEEGGSDLAAEETRPMRAAYRPGREVLTANLDTLVFLPDDGVFYQVWRATYPLPDLALDSIASIDIRMAGANAAPTP